METDSEIQSLDSKVSRGHEEDKWNERYRFWADGAVDITIIFHRRENTEINNNNN